MSDRPPATRLHCLLSLVVDAETLRHVVEPSIADLQYEAASARTRPARAVAVLRGYAGVVRALMVAGTTTPRTLIAGVAIVGLGVMGAALWNWARLASTDPRVGESGLLLPTFAVPVLACAIEGKRTYARSFALSLAAGAASVVALDVVVSTFDASRLIGHVIRLSNGAWSSALTSALAAALVWSPFDARARFAQRVATALVYAALLSAAVFVLRNDGMSAQSAHYFVMRAPFFVVLFSLMLGLTVLPLLLIARRWLARVWTLTLFAGLCAPAPIVAAAIVDGDSLPRSIANCLHWSWPALVSSLPFLTGAMTLGWLIAQRRTPEESAT